MGISPNSAESNSPIQLRRSAAARSIFHIAASHDVDMQRRSQNPIKKRRSVEMECEIESARWSVSLSPARQSLYIGPVWNNCAARHSETAPAADYMRPGD